MLNCYCVRGWAQNSAASKHGFSSQFPNYVLLRLRIIQPHGETPIVQQKNIAQTRDVFRKFYRVDAPTVGDVVIDDGGYPSRARSPNAPQCRDIGFSVRHPLRRARRARPTLYDAPVTIGFDVPYKKSPVGIGVGAKSSCPFIFTPTLLPLQVISMSYQVPVSSLPGRVTTSFA